MTLARLYATDKTEFAPLHFATLASLRCVLPQRGNLYTNTKLELLRVKHQHVQHVCVGNAHGEARATSSQGDQLPFRGVVSPTQRRSPRAVGRQSNQTHFLCLATIIDAASGPPPSDALPAAVLGLMPASAPVALPTFAPEPHATRPIEPQRVRKPRTAIVVKA